MSKIACLRSRSWLSLLVLALLALSSGCAMVTVKSVAPSDYVSVKRGDVLNGGKLSAGAQEMLSVVGLTEAQCERDLQACHGALSSTEGLQMEQRLSTLAELWVKQAMALTPKGKALEAVALPEEALDAWLEAARYAYAYLFFSGRTPAQRTLEERQNQVLDYYNYAAEQTAAMVFQRSRAKAIEGAAYTGPLRAERWTLDARFDQLRLNSIPVKLVSAASTSFVGMRRIYRRDGIGAELVVVMEPPPLAYPIEGEEDDSRQTPFYSEMPAINATAVLRFHGATLEEVLATRQLTIEAYSPENTASVVMEGQRVPLAANFTAAYGLWLAQSGFATESLRTLFGRGQGIREPHIYLMEPYDPKRRIIFLMHGLASSPEAWVNLVNEVMGDPVMRAQYQVWSVYYPTNAPIALNRYTISRAFNRTLRHFDPQGSALASRDMVFIGHSMGGVLARLMLSSSGEVLWNNLVQRYDLRGERLRRVEKRLGSLLHFSPQPNVSRAIFIATPHKGTDIAGNRLGRAIGKLVRLPFTILGSFAEVFLELNEAGAEQGKAEKVKVPNSIDNLKSNDPFIEAAANLPMAPGLKYHSIIAHRKVEVPLLQSDDGLVPYWSAHLEGALSEKVVISGHSVQESAEAVLEVRRILRQDLREHAALP